MSVNTRFIEPGPLRDGDLELRLARCAPFDPVTGYVPTYHFDMIDLAGGDVAGKISLRLGDSDFLTHFGGQISYGVSPAFRGRRRAARACRLLFPLASSHGVNPLWITCNPDNIASRLTCERAGGVLAGIVDLPADCDMYAEGERHGRDARATKRPRFLFSLSSLRSLRPCGSIAFPGPEMRLLLASDA
jgi:hypothetical protein